MGGLIHAGRSAGGGPFARGIMIWDRMSKIRKRARLSCSGLRLRVNAGGRFMHRALFTLLCCMIPLAAQSWDDLRALKAGDRVKVQDTAGKERGGAFRALSDNAISIESGGSEVSIERSKVRRVQIKSSSRRWRNFAIGAGIGLALGLAADYTLGTYLRNETSQGGAARALTYIAPIALFGGVGAAAAGYKTIYRAR